MTVHPIIVFVYTLLAYREERDMIEKFGDRFEQYRRRVPMFSPGRGGWHKLLEQAKP